MASLLLSEAVLDSKLCNRPLYIATLDAQKAFDVVSHPVLMVKLYEQGINSHLWQLIRSMYSGLTARVQWSGEISSSVNICQGVRQGGILSTHFYKTYNNDLLTELESRCLGKFIGPIYVGCPTVADDVLLISEDDVELQLMFNLSYIKSQEKRFHIHPQKTVIVKKNVSKAKQKQEVISDWKLGSTSVNVNSQSVHLGLIRAEKAENNINISDRISLARRTLYSLIKAGVHGNNGLNPKVSYRIYQAYVIPRLLFNLETLHLNKTQLNQLQRFHISNLRNFQSLPVRTASSAVQLLLGALPIQAEIHRRQLSLIHSIVRSSNTRIQDVMYGQTALGSPESFFRTAQDTLELYDLPDISSLSTLTKFQWRKSCRQAVSSYWSERLREEASDKPTLSNCNLMNMAIGKSHLIWENVDNNTVDVKRGITKARMLTGVYMLQSTKARFNQYDVEQICPLCRLATEDLQHMLLRCPALSEVRSPLLSSVRVLLIRRFGVTWWSSRSSAQIVALCLDSSNINDQINHSVEGSFLCRLETLERERRHFPDIHNQKGVLPCYKPHGRRYIPHGYGIYEEWRPHPQNVQVDYSEAGPDWKSRIKYIPDPENPRYPAAEIFENNWHAMRPYPYTYMRTNNEWLLDPGLSSKGMRCTFNGEHLATKTSSNEITHQMLFGQGRNLGYIDKRNGIGVASQGDKSYQVPEYSPGFHKLGSALPIVEFGANSPWKKTKDTFVPLQPLPQTPREPYKNIARRKERDEEVKTVKALDNWRPATPLKPEKMEEKK